MVITNSRNQIYPFVSFQPLQETDEDAIITTDAELQPAASDSPVVTQAKSPTEEVSKEPRPKRMRTKPARYAS